jgi:RNA polymerase sigma factor (TIGR02999 family)
MTPIGNQNQVSAAAEAPAVTRLLNEARRGDAHAGEVLLPLVYEQLRRLAASKMRRERSDQTLQATALVHEVYLRLVDQSQVQHWEGRWHFYAAAAEAMRRILVERARNRSRLKRGGGLNRVSLDSAQELTVDQPPDDLLALDEALAELAIDRPQEAKLVKLRYFGGLSVEQAAEALGISIATAGRDWRYARAWLYRRMSGK